MNEEKIIGVRFKNNSNGTWFQKVYFYKCVFDAKENDIVRVPMTFTPYYADVKVVITDVPKAQIAPVILSLMKSVIEIVGSENH